MKYQTDDLLINSIKVLLPPLYLQREFPITEGASTTVYKTRESIKNILNKQDDRLLVIVGPCSIHDETAALEYAVLLRDQIKQFGENLCIVMRVYFEKPRTTIGWTGLIRDPYVDGSAKVNEGLRVARKLLVNLAEIGVPAGSEFVDLITPQYTADLISWGAIGARTTESQLHRQLASGLSCPVGFKNGTNGNLQIAVDAVSAASHSHYFLSHTKNGYSAIFETKGNPYCHIILRGGKEPNYSAEEVNKAMLLLKKAKLREHVMIDCSHANSNKDWAKQSVVCRNLIERIANGEKNILGIMLESHLVSGNQQIRYKTELRYGQSITDGCIGWQETKILLEELSEAVCNRRQRYMN